MAWIFLGCRIENVKISVLSFFLSVFDLHYSPRNLHPSFLAVLEADFVGGAAAGYAEHFLGRHCQLLDSGSIREEMWKSWGVLEVVCNQR
jgi:hypothetical protein